MNQLNIAGRHILAYDTGRVPEWLLIQPVDHHDIEGLEAEMAYIGEHSSKSFTLVALHINDWNNELSPWAAPSVFRNKPFGNGATETLRFIREELLTRFDAPMKCLGGYSLAGLFALWAGCQTRDFHAIVGASPSVWFNNWIDYASSHETKAQRVYLSLGDKEPEARNPVLASVGKRIEQQYNLLGCERILEWNIGNHFKDNPLRIARGFVWAMEQD